MTRPARALIDLQALHSNFQRARAAAPNSRIMAVLKSNAYGHGAVAIARGLPTADAFGVACVEEAIELREAGMQQPVVLLEGFFEPSEIGLVAAYELDLVVRHEQQLEFIEGLPPSNPVSVWLKIDTGMHRLGFAPERVAEVVRRLGTCDAVQKRLRFMSHLACADDPGSAVTRDQEALFRMATEGLEGERSLANSAGLLAWPKTHYDWVRPGIMLYGVSPLLTESAEQLTVQPVMTLSSRLIDVRTCRRGDAVGYGGDWVCPEDMSIGIVAIGYGDGYPRHAPQGTPVLVNDRRVPLIGRVSMDMICVDLRTQPEAGPGDRVDLWGPGLPVDEIAQCAGTIAYELLCGVTSRVAVEILEPNTAADRA